MTTNDALTEADVRQRVEALAAKAGSMRALAREWDVSPSYLGDFLNGRRGPGPQILEPLGLIQEVTVRYIEGRAGGRRRQPKTKSPVKRPVPAKRRDPKA